MRRRLARALLILLIGSVTVLYPLLAPPAHRIDKEHFDKIVRGMTKEQVETILGVPPGQYDWAEPDPSAVSSISFFVTAANAAGVSLETMMPRRQVLALNAGSLDPRIIHEWAALSVSWVQTSTWTSRHGSFRVHFDSVNRVISTDVQEVRIVPPWQRWWRAWKD